MTVRDNILKSINYLVALEGSKTGFAKKVGVSKQTLNNWVSAKNAPDIETIAAISEKCDVSLSAILDGNLERLSKSERLFEQVAVAQWHDVALSTLIDIYHSLDSIGQGKLCDYAQDLLDTGRYSE